MSPGDATLSTALSVSTQPGTARHPAWPRLTVTVPAATAPSLHPHQHREAPCNADLAPGSRGDPGGCSRHSTARVCPRGRRGSFTCVGQRQRCSAARAVGHAQSVACWSGAGPGSAAGTDGSRWDPGLPEGLGPGGGAELPAAQASPARAEWGQSLCSSFFWVTLLSPGPSLPSLHPGLCRTAAGDCGVPHTGRFRAGLAGGHAWDGALLFRAVPCWPRGQEEGKLRWQQPWGPQVPGAAWRRPGCQPVPGKHG